MASTQNATLNKPGLLYNAGTFNGPISSPEAAAQAGPLVNNQPLKSKLQGLAA